MKLFHILFLFSISFSSFMLNAHEEIKGSILTLTSEGRLSIPADQVEISLQVITDKPDAESALLENNEKMEKVFFSLKEIGLDENEFETGGFNISPIYNQPPKKHDPEWISKIDHYRVTNTIIIKTQKLSLAGQIIDSSLNSGANSLNSLTFNLKNERSNRSRLIKNAAHNAIQDATALAEELGQKILKIKEITLNDSFNPSPVYGKMLYRTASTSTPLQAGSVELTASLTLIFEIEPKQL